MKPIYNYTLVGRSHLAMDLFALALVAILFLIPIGPAPVWIWVVQVLLRVSILYIAYLYLGLEPRLEFKAYDDHLELKQGIFAPFGTLNRRCLPARKIKSIRGVTGQPFKEIDAGWSASFRSLGMWRPGSEWVGYDPYYVSQDNGALAIETTSGSRLLVECSKPEEAEAAIQRLAGVDSAVIDATHAGGPGEPLYEFRQYRKETLSGLAFLTVFIVMGITIFGVNNNGPEADQWSQHDLAPWAWVLLVVFMTFPHFYPRLTIFGYSDRIEISGWVGPWSHYSIATKMVASIDSAMLTNIDFRRKPGRRVVDAGWGAGGVFKVLVPSLIVRTQDGLEYVISHPYPDDAATRLRKICGLDGEFR